MSSIDTWTTPTADLTGSTVVVVGGSGGVGEGVVRSTLAAGATVIATGRDGARLDALAARLATAGLPGHLHTRVLDAMRPTLDGDVAAIAHEFGAFDGVVVSLASWGDQGRKPALALDDDEWQRLLDGNLTSVFRVFRAFLPEISASGVLMQLNGMSADIPFPGSAGVALSAAATKSLSLTLDAELGGRGPRIVQLVLGVIRTRARQTAGIDDPRWIDATQVGDHVAHLVAGSSPLARTPLQYFTDRAEGPRPGSSTR
ncbi:SDR family NAD(P)-dependent oxidoreductase [Curtobacterium sp. A7_M15]|uniref:SDR family oxidoreductase n=1 Tax=Curtobacterium sp. A7_M15 TaxID=3065241 RepID=UPI002737EE2D|nr:SDR family NAD(P)-dependent oxidoreductase [Curtobacterium sp. A7_M15]MDP4332653.1 SDR family NAD(P)-dependent oxidoreductase [Curtobacterium sp. A7_M15]